jgi:hypothetical protein
MAIEFFDGFEAGQLPEWTFNGNVNIATNPPRSGTYVLTGGSNGPAYLALSATTKKTIGFAYRYDNVNVYTRSEHSIAAFQSSTVQHLVLKFNSSGNLVVNRGDGTTLATAAGVLLTNVFHYIEFQATIADSGGTAIVRVNGVQVINFTGDTRNAGTTTTPDRFYFYPTGSANNYWDDLYVTNEIDATATTGRADDSFLGDVKVAALVPDGNGAVSQWVGSDSDSTNNYLLVDEVPPNTTDYTGSAVDGNRDLWSVGDIPVTALVVYAVQANVYASKSDAGAASLKIIHRDSAGTVTAGSTMPLSTTWAWYRSNVLTAKPSGGSWTAAEVNALQVGVEKA